VLLHVDEIHLNHELTVLILDECDQTMTCDSGILVLPILSGVEGFSRSLASQAMVKPLQLMALEKEDLLHLEGIFSHSLELDSQTYYSDTFKTLRSLFAMCCGMPYLVSALRNETCTTYPAELKGGTLGDVHAGVLFNNVVSFISSRYGGTRWHSLLHSKPGHTGDVRHSIT
jgi:hypothetical protein